MIASSGSRASRVRSTSRTPSGTGAPGRSIAELAFVLQQADELADEERVAGGAVVQRVGERRVGVVADDCGDVVADLVDRETGEREAFEVGGARQRRERVRERRRARLGIAERPDEQHGRLLQRRDRELQQSQRALVGPVQVVEHDDERLLRRQVAQRPCATASKNRNRAVSASGASSAAGDERARSRGRHARCRRRCPRSPR